MREGDSTSTTNSFVGRERELAELISACEAGADSDAHLFLISGEPGIGKTRLADELAARIKARGLQVLWGRCWEGDGAPAYWPWIQIIRGFLGGLDPERRNNLAVDSEIAAEVIHEVAQIIPDLRPTQSLPTQSAGEKLEPSEARFRLFDAVTNFLKIGARSHPMLIVLDDLHDADEASLALLHFMARELKGAAISIVATYRDLEVRRSPSLSKMIGELSREARSIPVGGLNESEVTKLVEFSSGQTPDEMLVAKLCAATNGNPLFVDGVVRNLIAEGALGNAAALDRPFKIPSGMREAIRGRLDGLSPESNSILAAAAAIGNEFEFNLCQSVANVSTDEAHRLLDEATHAGIVTALRHGRYRFSHSLIRQAVYDELDTNGRVRIHGKIANRLEEIYREDIDPHLAELAHHFREASVTEKAIEYSIRAGQAAVPIGANADAVTHWEAALGLMEAHGLDARPRAVLLQWLGDLALAIDQPKSVRFRESAIALFESLGYLSEAARIRIFLGRSFATVSQPITNGPLAIEHLRRAESVLTKGPDTVELAWLYEAIAAYEQQRLDLPSSARAAKRTMEISERIGDKTAWSAGAGFHGNVLALSGRLKEAFEIFDQAFDAADQANNPGSGLVVANFGGFCRFWLGDPLAGRAWLEREVNRPRNARNPWARLNLSSPLTTTYVEEGQIGELSRRWGPKEWAVRFWVGGKWEAVTAWFENVVGAAERADDRTLHLSLSVYLGAMYIILGEYARAEAHLLYGLDNGDRGRLVLYEIRARPLLALTYVAMNRLDTAAEEVARCHEIMAAGENWRGRTGDVARAEGVVAAARGNFDFAYRQFEAAVVIQRKYHMAGDEADTLQYWGRALASAGDRIKAAEKFDAAIELNRARGVGPRFLEWLIADKMRALGGASPLPQPTTSKTAGAFRKEGEFWTITYGGTTFRLKDAKGLHYLAYLLARPGQPIHVHDLIEAVDGSAANGRTPIHAESEDLEIVREIGGPTPTIDAHARSEYRTRLRDLQTDLDEAERMNDLGRCESLRSEIEMVGQELTGSSGLGGSARAVSSSAERARGMVGRNIRSVVERIRHQHPALGRHLATTIRTGYFCVYQADPDHIFWQL